MPPLPRHPATTLPSPLPALLAGLLLLLIPSGLPAQTSSHTTAPPPPTTPTPTPTAQGTIASRVLFASDPAAIGPGGSVRPAAVASLLRRLLLALTGRRTEPEAILALANPASDTIGIKVATSGRGIAGTRPETAAALAASLRAAGFPRSRIIVWDRGREDLLAAGFSPSHPDYTLRWIEGPDAFDPDATFSSPLMGRLTPGDRLYQPLTPDNWHALQSPVQFSSKSHLPTLLTRTITKIIHLPGLQDSVLTGIHGALADLTLPNLDNSRRLAGPPHYGDPALAEAALLPTFRNKLILTIMDGLFLQYAGGPFPSPAETLEHATLYASYDPVALDATARQLINTERALRRLPTVNRMTPWLDTAQALGLGHSDPKRILLREAPPLPRTHARQSSQHRTPPPPAAP